MPIYLNQLTFYLRYEGGSPRFKYLLNEILRSRKKSHKLAEAVSVMYDIKGETKQGKVKTDLEESHLIKWSWWHASASAAGQNVSISQC